MRSFIVASIILIAICIMIGINSFYVTSRTDKLISMCEAIKADSSAYRITELVSEWQSCRDIIALSVHRADLERAENAIGALEKYKSDSQDFNYHLSILISAIEHIANGQKFSVDSIF